MTGERYEVIMGSDIVRDGMFLELWDRPSSELAVEVFFSDTDGSFATTRYRNDLPPEVDAWFHSEALRRLPQSQTPNQVACCQGAIHDAHAGSNGVRLLSTP